MNLACLARKIASVATETAILRERGEVDGTDWERIDTRVTEMETLIIALRDAVKSEGVFIDESIRE